MGASPEQQIMLSIEKQCSPIGGSTDEHLHEAMWSSDAL
jgi:hypothetical protein